MSTKPQLGIWRLLAPNGRTYLSDSPLGCCHLERDERLPLRHSPGYEYRQDYSDEVEDNFVKRHRWIAEAHGANTYADLVDSLCQLLMHWTGYQGGWCLTWPKDHADGDVPPKEGAK